MEGDSVSDSSSGSPSVDASGGVNVGGSNYYDDITLIYQQSFILPILIATTSVLFYRLKSLFQLRDVLLFQIAFLVALILSHLLMYIKTTNHLSSFSSLGGDSVSASELESTTELCYIPIFLAIIVSAETSDINNKRRRNKIRFIFNVAMQSLVPASLSFVYTTLFLNGMARHQKRHNNITKNDSTTISSSSRITDLTIIVLTFVFSWTLLTLWTIRGSRRHLRIKPSPSFLPSQYNMNVSNSSRSSDGSIFSSLGNNDNFVDENQWQKWTNDHLLSWIKALYEKQEKLQKLQSVSRYSCGRPGSGSNNYNIAAKSNVDIQLDNINDEVILQILETFQKQGINGSFLPYVQVQDLIRMGIPYCHAVHLCVNFRALIDKSQPLDEHFNNTENGGEVGIDLDKWLGKKIGGGSTSSSVVHDAVAVNGAEEIYTVNNDQEGEVHTGLQEASPSPSPQYDHVKDIMSSRYGMELPELRQPSNTHNAQSPSMPTQTQRQPPMPPPTTNNVASMKNSDNENMTIDLALLDAMPPNIREIASRRPDLVKAIHKKFVIESSNERITEKSTSRPKVVRFEMDQLNDPDEEEGNEMSQHNDFIENSDGGSGANYFDSEIEGMDEMVGLLRRRRVKRS